jgi:hypothetical protein
MIGNVMRKIYNIEVESTSNMTGGIASYLITQFRKPDTKPWELSGYGREFIRLAEARVKELA